MTTATLTEAGTYKGKTAAEWRAEAKTFYQAREESWERSDSDGFVSQWASGLTAQQYSESARLAEANGITEYVALFDLNGELIPTLRGYGDYGVYFTILDNDERGCKRFFNPSKAKNPETARKNNAAKGFYVGTVKMAGKVEILGGGKGLGGAANCYVLTVPQTRNDNGTVIITAEHVIEIVDNGQEATPADLVAREIHTFLADAARRARTNDAAETLMDAAELVLGGHFETARKMLTPLRTRASLAAIRALKAL